MKTFWKILAALVTIAGVVFVLATYGDKLVAWAKKLLSNCGCYCDCDCCCDDDDCCCGDDCCCDCEQDAVQADEADFEG